MKVKPVLRRRHTGKGHVTDGGVAVRVWGDDEGSWVICIAHMEDVSSDYCQMLCMKSIPPSVISPCVRAHTAEHSEQLFWPSPGLRRVALRVLSDFLSHVLCFSNSLVEFWSNVQTITGGNTLIDDDSAGLSAILQICNCLDFYVTQVGFTFILQKSDCYHTPKTSIKLHWQRI